MVVGAGVVGLGATEVCVCRGAWDVAHRRRAAVRSRCPRPHDKRPRPQIEVEESGQSLQYLNCICRDKICFTFLLTHNFC